MSNHDAPLSLTSTIRRSEDNLHTEMGDTVVLMSIGKGNYYSLDAIGADIWRRLEGQVQVADLCTSLSNDYEADSETIRRDVLALLERLASEGLIVITT